jgi:DNA helicase-2/ATP-dependent DNA helicase PcrA
MEHLHGLNDAQREAVLHTSGPLLVLAGAGAGKTRVITHRMLQIIRGGVAPEQILAITFTNKAAGEMRERVLKLLREDRAVTRPVFEQFKPPFVSTFHSLGLTIIKENSRLLGFTRTPVIYDRGDSMKIIKEILKPLGNEEVEPRAILSAISRQKGEGFTAEEFATKAEYSRDRFISSIWRAYDRALHEQGALDFDDLLGRAVALLRKHPELQTRYQERWPYMHIDEYQDTNRIQAEMAELLVGVERNICAVGDIDQTIYGWRGAQIANILSFEKKFPGSRIVSLEENYRSTKTILAAANQVIAKNMYRRDKNLFTKNADGEAIGFYQAYDELDEAAFITRKISELRGRGARPKDFAVLYRANFQSRAIEEALLRSQVPYQVLGTRLFERKEVKDLISYIRAALYETNADIARIANVPVRGIGKVTLLKMLAGAEDTLTGATREKVLQFRNLLRRIREQAAVLKPTELITFVLIESGLERSLKEDKIEGAERLENVRELGSLAVRYDLEPIPHGLESFLESAALASDQDELKDEKNSVRLMTVHASKGLEFPYVFIVGLEEGLFPYEREGENDADKEEERRLMYVALTRAEKKLFLSAAAVRTVFGSKRATLPSQFLSDIDDSLMELESPERLGKTIYLD